MPIIVVRKPPKERPADQLQGTIFGIEITVKATGAIQYDTWGFPSEQAFKDALAIWNGGGQHRFHYKADPLWKTRQPGEESFVQPVL